MKQKWGIMFLKLFFRIVLFNSLYVVCIHSLVFCISLAVPLKDSKWVHTHWSGERATLTLVHLNKEDEGIYTMRINTKSGFDTYSAYVFVRGKVPSWSSSLQIYCKKRDFLMKCS